MEGLSKEQLLAVLQRARSARERDWLMYLLAYWHGLRSSEVVGLTADSVSDGFIRVARLKGSERTTQRLKEHENPLLNEAAGVLELTNNQTSNQKLFPITREHYCRLFKCHARAVGIPPHLAHPHVLKHTLAHIMLNSEGVKIHEVRKRLGHKSLQSTGKYLEISDSQADEAVEKIDFEV